MTKRIFVLGCLLIVCASPRRGTAQEVTAQRAEVSATSYEAITGLRFSDISLRAIRDMRALRGAAAMAKYGKMLGPFVDLFESTGSSRLFGVQDIATADWEGLANAALQIADTERKTMRLMAQNARSELGFQPKYLQHPQELKFWENMAEVFK